MERFQVDGTFINMPKANTNNRAVAVIIRAPEHYATRLHLWWFGPCWANGTHAADTDENAMMPTPIAMSMSLAPLHSVYPSHGRRMQRRGF